MPRRMYDIKACVILRLMTNAIKLRLSEISLANNAIELSLVIVIG